MSSEKDDIYFTIEVQPLEYPDFRYTGGTKCISEMLTLQFGEILDYIHQHAEIKILNRLRTEKNPEEGRRLLELGRVEGGVQGILTMNKAISELPESDWRTAHQYIRNVLQKEEMDEQLLQEIQSPAEDFVSHKIKVESSEKQGRYVVATEDIEVGETVLKESPFVSYLHASHRYSNCATCLRSVLFGVGCTQCNQILFCSQLCRDQGVFHKTECGNTDILPPNGPISTVLRIFTSRGLSFFMENLQSFNPGSPEIQLGVGKEMSQLFRLQAGCRQDSMYRMEKYVWTYYLLYLLKRLGFFVDQEPGTFGREEVIVAMLIQHILRIADDNCHEICELGVPEDRSMQVVDIVQNMEDVSSLMRVIGAAIYLNTSFFNNSCDVNTMKFHRGCSEIMEAKRDIRAGDEISDFYGEYFFLGDRLSRKKNLGFSCCCQPCQENWPLKDQLPTFTADELKEKAEWTRLCAELNNAATQVDLQRTKTTCKQLGRLASVQSPHAALVMPEMTLNFSNLLENNSKSLEFLFWHPSSALSKN